MFVISYYFIALLQVCIHLPVETGLLAEIQSLGSGYRQMVLYEEELSYSNPNIPFYDVEEAILAGHTVKLVLATTRQELRQGLSHVTEKELQRSGDGMAFVFDDSSVRHFWMKDMRFDLDVVWVQEGHVVKITEDVQAPSQEGMYTRRMNSLPYEVDLVLEFPAGFVDERGVEVGDRVEWTGMYGH